VQCQEVEEKVCFEQAFTEDVSKEAEKCSAEVNNNAILPTTSFLY
jgi:hypothetical protein